jgi:hypothetical protein
MAKTQVKERPKQPQQAEPATTTCQHHWLIESPRGALSIGRCKRCGEEREFRNSTSDHVWEDDSSSGYNPWRGVRTTAPARSDDDDVSTSPSAGGGALMV